MSDDLVSPVLTEEDYNRRYLIINLLKLPENIEKRVEEQINFLPEKGWDINKLPFPTLHQRFKDIYKKDRVVSYEKSMAKLNRRKKC